VGGCGCHDGRKATSPASSSSPTACRRFTTPLQPPPACITSSPQPQLQVGGRGTGNTLKVGWETCAVKEGIVGPTKQATISIRSDAVCVSRCFTMWFSPKVSPTKAGNLGQNFRLFWWSVCIYDDHAGFSWCAREDGPLTFK